MSKINKINVSGVSYDIEDASKVQPEVVFIDKTINRATSWTDAGDIALIKNALIRAYNNKLPLKIIVKAIIDYGSTYNNVTFDYIMVENGNSLVVTQTIPVFSQTTTIKNYSVNYTQLCVYSMRFAVDATEAANYNLTDIYNTGTTTSISSIPLVSGSPNIFALNNSSSLIAQDNTSSWTPRQNYGLVHKKYVDDAIAAISSGASVNYFDARQAFLFEGKDVGIYYPTNTNRINFMYNFLSGDSGGAKNGTVISFVIVNKVTAENPDSTKTYAVGTFLDGAGALQQFVLTYNGTNYVMTYYNNYYGAYMLTNYAQTINGIKTFGSFPVTPSSAPTTDYQTANKKYVDDLVGNINTVLATLTTPSNGGGN